MSRLYPLHELYDNEFEDLVFDVCQNILGAGTLKFAKRNDGGRDARFNGTANRYPSEASPWTGKIVIQAKHTGDFSAYLSDGSFIKNDIVGEYDKLKNLLSEQEIDYYLIFTNRRGSFEKSVEIRRDIANQTSIPFDNIEIIGYEYLNEHLRNNKQLVEKYLTTLLSPIRFYEEDIKNIIICFRDNYSNIKALSEETPSQTMYLDKERKNELNNLSKEYFDRIIAESLSYFTKIKEFLEDPQNDAHREAFLDTVSDLNDVITSHRDRYDKFEEIIIKINETIKFKYHDELKYKRRLINVFLHYMYWDCFIGKKQ